MTWAANFASTARTNPGQLQRGDRGEPGTKQKRGLTPLWGGVSFAGGGSAVADPQPPRTRHHVPGRLDKRLGLLVTLEPNVLPQHFLSRVAPSGSDERHAQQVFASLAEFVEDLEKDFGGERVDGSAVRWERRGEVAGGGGRPTSTVRGRTARLKVSWVLIEGLTGDSLSYGESTARPGRHGGVCVFEWTSEERGTRQRKQKSKKNVSRPWRGDRGQQGKEGVGQAQHSNYNTSRRWHSHQKTR